MKIHYADKIARRVEDIESGTVFKYELEFYIATTDYDYEIDKRTCVNVVTGSSFDIPFNIVVECFNNSYITIKGGE